MQQLEKFQDFSPVSEKNTSTESVPAPKRQLKPRLHQGAAQTGFTLADCGFPLLCKFGMLVPGKLRSNWKCTAKGNFGWSWDGGRFWSNLSGDF